MDQYETVFDISKVVAAESESDARTIHPSDMPFDNDTRSWVAFESIAHISVEYLGETKKERGVICASFNAG